MIAQIDESAPPYKFQLVKGGKFNIDNQYGMITRQKFCLVGIGKTSSDDSSDDTSSEEGDPPSDDNTSSDNVHYDIEHTDINDVTLTAPTQQDKEVVFETHQNGKSITSFHYNN